MLYEKKAPSQSRRGLSYLNDSEQHTAIASYDCQSSKSATTKNCCSS